MNTATSILTILAGCIFFYFLFKKLTLAGAITALLLAVVIYTGVGYGGILLIGSFFLLGTAATSYQRKKKEALGYAEMNKGKRNAAQVLANGGVPMLLGILALWLSQYKDLCLLLSACALSSATADTLSSELGMVWGRRTFNILSWRKDRGGENGVVSWEGFAAGLAGSVIISCVYAAVAATSTLQNILFIIASGTLGNIADSVLGATLERKNLLGNNAVNLLNTLFAALAGFLLQMVFTYR